MSNLPRWRVPLCAVRGCPLAPRHCMPMNCISAYPTLAVFLQIPVPPITSCHEGFHALNLCKRKSHALQRNSVPVKFVFLFLNETISTTPRARRTEYQPKKSRNETWIFQHLSLAMPYFKFSKIPLQPYFSRNACIKSKICKSYGALMGLKISYINITKISADFLSKGCIHSLYAGFTMLLLLSLFLFKCTPKLAEMIQNLQHTDHLLRKMKIGCRD